MMTDKKYTTDIDNVYQRLSERINEHERRSAHSLRRVPRPVYYWATAAVLLLLLSIGLGLGYKHKNGASQLVIVSAADGRLLHVLPDSSQVWLNTGSKIVYPAKFTSAQREVFLSGEAFFDVKKRAGKKFYVKTGKLEIQVLGTQFDVKAYDNENEVVASLVTGEIEVSLENGDCTQVSLKPGEQLRHNKENHSTTIYKDVDMDVYTSWKRGFLRFKQNSIEEVASQLARAYGTNIEIVSQKLSELTFSGKLDLQGSLEEVLHVLQISAPFTYYTSGKTIILTD